MTTPPIRAIPFRWLIVVLLFFISVVTYIDRVNISVTARHMMPAFGLTSQEMGWIFSAFVLGYAIFQIPGGWMADRWGTRSVLTGALLWWSGCTALTAIAASSSLADLIGIVGALLVVRFLLGVGEAVAIPSFNRAVTNWMPTESRGTGIGIAVSGIGLGSAVTPPAAAWLMVNWGWQTVFYLSAAIGLFVGILWWALSRDRPSQHPWVTMPANNPTDLEQTQQETGVPWNRLLRTPTVWWLVASYTCLGYVAYLYLSWFYLYLVNVRGFDVLLGGWYAATPFLAILIGCPLGGWATDRLVTHRGVTIGRAVAGASGMASAGCAIAVGGYTDSPSLAVASLSIGAGCLYFSVGAYWASTSDLSKAHAGTLSGIMNTGANIGGAISPSLIPWIADHWGWSTSLVVTAAVAIVGALIWLKIDPGKGLQREEC